MAYYFDNILGIFWNILNIFQICFHSES
jgi:hypothetical protein